MNNAGKILLLALSFCLVFVFSAWAAERIILKNGNELTGEIIEETGEYVVLSILQGKGRTKLYKSEIVSIREIQPVKQAQEEKGQEAMKETAPSEKERKVSAPPAKSNPIFAYLFFAIAAVFLAYVFIFSAIRHRPAGIKIIFLLEGTKYIFLILAGLMLLPFITDKVFAAPQGRNQIPFPLVVFIFFVFPLLCMVILFYLFHLRKWARVAFSVLLVAGFLNTTAIFLLHNKIQGAYSSFTPGTTKTAPPEAGQEGKNSGNQFAQIISAVWTLVFLLYLNLPRTRKHFEKPLPVSKTGVIAALIVVPIFFFLGDGAYRLLFSRFISDPYLFFTPVKIPAVVERPAFSSRYDTKYIEGARLFLPADMRLFSNYSTAGPTIYLDVQKGRCFSIDKLDKKDFRIFSVIERARWNPILLTLKAISTPRPPFHVNKQIFSKEITFPHGKVFLKLREGKDGLAYLFLLQSKDKFFYGMILGNKNDDFVSEKIVIEMLSLIE